MKKIYFKIDTLLRELGATPNQLAEESTVRTATIYNFVHNKIQRINIDTLEKILYGLNVIAMKKGIKKEIHIHDIIDCKGKIKKLPKI